MAKNTFAVLQEIDIAPESAAGKQTAYLPLSHGYSKTSDAKAWLLKQIKADMCSSEHRYLIVNVTAAIAPVVKVEVAEVNPADILGGAVSPPEPAEAPAPLSDIIDPPAAPPAVIESTADPSIVATISGQGVEPEAVADAVIDAIPEAVVTVPQTQPAADAALPGHEVDLTGASTPPPLGGLAPPPGVVLPTAPPAAPTQDGQVVAPPQQW